MRALESAVELLRQFVESKKWDYCVVWKLGDDPSRFIEWMDCCCSGGTGVDSIVKVERDDEQEIKPTGPLCRDAHFQHPIRTKACEALAHFPLFISLYPGVHGEVIVSNQARWLSHAEDSDSNSSSETTGTRVLIPVSGGIVELFASKQMPQDQSIVELVRTRCSAPLEEDLIKFITAEIPASVSVNEQSVDPSLEGNLQNLPLSIHLSTTIPRIFLSPIAQPNFDPSLDGSSNGFIDSAEISHISRKEQVKRLVGKCCGTKRPMYSENVSKQEGTFSLDCKKKDAKDKASATRHYKSKNLVTERNRRNKIKDGLFTLRALVPKITKMDRIAILGDAITYIAELQEEEKRLRDELRTIEEDDNKKSNEELKFAMLDGDRKDTTLTAKYNQISSGISLMKQMKAHVEVNQITKRDFLIKLFCENRRGGFARLMEAMNSLGLQVIDANVTTFDGKVLNIFKVEANKDIQARKLKDFLAELASKTN